MMTIRKLREQHDQLAKIVARLRICIGHPKPPATVELFALRKELNAALIGHLKAEDWILYPKLLARADPATAATARQFMDEMGGLAAGFLAYAHKWDAGAIERDWPDYCRETQGIIDALSRRIFRENEELYPLADRERKAA